MLRQCEKWLLTLSLPLLLVGCGSQAGVSGTVTYDGKEVEDGFISFLPEGDGPSAGTPVKNGRYETKGLVPGRYRVTVTWGRKLEFPTESGVPVKDPNPGPVDIIPADAVGNNQTKEIAPGNQTLDFELKPPGK